MVQPYSFGKIGQYLEKLLKIDSHIEAGLRGKYVHICIQVDLNKPLKMKIQINKETLKLICLIIVKRESHWWNLFQIANQ